MRIPYYSRGLVRLHLSTLQPLALPSYRFLFSVQISSLEGLPIKPLLILSLLGEVSRWVSGLYPVSVMVMIDRAKAASVVTTEIDTDGYTHLLDSGANATHSRSCRLFVTFPRVQSLHRYLFLFFGGKILHRNSNWIQRGKLSQLNTCHGLIYV